MISQLHEQNWKASVSSREKEKKKHQGLNMVRRMSSYLKTTTASIINYPPSF